MWRRWGYVAMDSIPDGCDIPHQRLLYSEWLAPPNSVQLLTPSETWGSHMVSGLLPLLSCAVLRPAHLASLCGFPGSGALEGALLTAAPNSGRKLFDSVLGVMYIIPPSAPRLPAGMRVAGCTDTQVNPCNHTMDLRESFDF